MTDYRELPIENLTELKQMKGIKQGRCGKNISLTQKGVFHASFSDTIPPPNCIKNSGFPPVLLYIDR